MENKEMMIQESRNSEVMFAAMRLGRALRRCPPEHGERPFPPAVGRMLMCVHENPGVSSRELCEMLDLRPSTLSELLGRAETDGWLIRAADEEDKRVQHISLTEQGERMISGMKAAREADAEKKTSCFSEEEKAQFIALCNRFSDHLEKLAIHQPPFPEGHGPHGKGPHGKGPHGRPGPVEEGGPGFDDEMAGPPHSWGEGPEEEHRRPPFPPGARIRC